jgi:hypothetical protein
MLFILELKYPRTCTQTILRSKKVNKQETYLTVDVIDVRIIAFVVPAESGKSLSELNLRFWESLSEIKSE